MNKNHSEEKILKLCNEYLELLDGLTLELINELEVLPYFKEEKDFICVHAGVPLDNNNEIIDMETATIEELIYDRSFKEPLRLPKSSKCIIFGHTPTFYVCGESKILAYKKEGTLGDSVKDYYKIHIDTGNYFSEVLGCWCVDTCEAVYVSRWDN